MKADMAADARPAARSRMPAWLVAVIPLALLGVLVAGLVRYGPAEVLLGGDYPPIEYLKFQRVDVRPEGIVATVFNDGPGPITVAQVQVDDAYWSFTASDGTVLKHLGRTTLTIPYPWVYSEPHILKVVSSTGATFEREISVAVETLRPDARSFLAFSLIGVYVGVVPVAIGLLWFPLMRRLGPRGLDFLLALTVGLLLYLFLEAGREGFEAAALVPDSLQGRPLFVFSALGAYLGLEALGKWMRARQQSVRTGGGGGWILALMIAIGIGLHNFGEGLAIGAAYALGEAALGTLLIIGFTLHNTTEGLAIVAPLSQEQVRLRDLAYLGLIGGAPTIAGAWIGGFVYSPIWSVLFLGIGAGAIVQVVLQIARHMSGTEGLRRHFTQTPALAGLFAGLVVMYVTGMLVG